MSRSFSVVDDLKGGEAFDSVEYSRAFFALFQGAIYLHQVYTYGMHTCADTRAMTQGGLEPPWGCQSKVYPLCGIPFGRTHKDVWQKSGVGEKLTKCWSGGHEKSLTDSFSKTLGGDHACNRPLPEK